MSFYGVSWCELRDVEIEMSYVIVEVTWNKNKISNFTWEKEIKSEWWMPWLWEAKKDVVSCDKHRGFANENWSGDFRMGKPSELKTHYPSVDGGELRELKHLSTSRKRKQNVIPRVVASESGRAQTCGVSASAGVVGLRYMRSNWIGSCLESQTIEGESPVRVRLWVLAVSWVARSTRNSAWISRDHPVRLNTPQRPIVNEYCEGKVKSTSNRGVK